MTNYVIDENVIMESIHGIKPDGSNADAEAELMYKILRGKDHIFLNKEIEKKIYSIPKKIERNHPKKDLNNRIYKRLIQVMRDSTRVSYVDGQLVNFEGPKKCDKQFVNVAIQSKSILLTADDKIKGPVKNGGSVVSKCVCKTAKEVLENEYKDDLKV